MVETALQADPFNGYVFVFRGRRGDFIKLLWWTGDDLCLLAKRLKRGRVVWPQANSGTVALSQAQLSMLLEGIDWRQSVDNAPRHKPARKPLPEHLPRDEREYQPQADACPACGGGLRHMGEDVVE
ncbi:IS66 Orf2 like protein [Janthinobacterium sp. HH103]|nr:IS66 Orf2 like protein [Janthinobacterium sp. HH100]OEZ74992.1 IS66 Orf2 like protein [Janthinobacterium sp. HH103]OEZ90520.1 IS66 Orf2 like protein [Janthinobacterium sp. HH106]QOU76307.1 IS66 Orf2 like protein [Janthinobacterium sp. HH102]